MFDVIRYRTRLDELVARHLPAFEERFGYPPGENVVVAASPGESAATLEPEFGPRVPADVGAFFDVIAQVSLPDFWNGYFLGPPSWIAGLHRAREPQTVKTGAGEQEVLVFGSDGGGTMYAVPLPEGRPVYKLPSGELRDGCYRHPLGTADSPPIIADDLEEFLTVLADGLESHVANGSPGPFS
ncbi:hypothetical protein [Nonomuraea sp. NPDC049480]|uniref:hypothetical protein n=1 Tax=Nonomuraea sp. NPDC049480 TaxID=3364353 RepID=UPI00379C1867